MPCRRICSCLYNCEEGEKQKQNIGSKLLILDGNYSLARGLFDAALFVAKNAGIHSINKALTKRSCFTSMNKAEKKDLKEFRKNIIGVNQEVPTIHNRKKRYINFDNAASTPALLPVMEEMKEFLGWYSGVHRGTGYKSLFSTQVYDDCRKVVSAYVNADPDRNMVIFLKNTTEAINKLAYRLNLSAGEMVLTTRMEHHSNDLPWRQRAVVKYVDVDDKGVLNLADLEKQLKLNYPRIKLLAVSGASNVTGHVNDIYHLAELAHEHKARILVDAAQLIPHQRLDLKPEGDSRHIDYLAFSGHKIYAPFGIGVLIGPKETFEHGEPEYVGGGTVDMVGNDQVYWTRPPDREEAGSPNVIGAFALAKTLQYLQNFDTEKIEKHEHNLTAYAMQQLKTVPGITVYGSGPRVSVVSFNMQGVNHGQLGAILCYEAGIGLRTGCFCAQPYVRKLLGEQEELKFLNAYKEKNLDKLPGMVRISLAAYNRFDEIDVLVDWLKKIEKHKKQYLKQYTYLPQYNSYLPAELEQRFKDAMPDQFVMAF